MSDSETAEKFAKRLYHSVHGRHYLREIKIRDAAVAHAAKVETLKEVLSEWKEHDGGHMSNHTMCYVKRVATRLGINSAELEPTPPYTVEAIRLVAGRLGYSIDCVDREWSIEEDRWVESGNKNLGFVTAAAIADHLRAMQHLPGGGK